MIIDVELILVFIILVLTVLSMWRRYSRLEDIADEYEVEEIEDEFYSPMLDEALAEAHRSPVNPNLYDDDAKVSYVV